MPTFHQSRPSDSPYIQSVSRIIHTTDNIGTAIPDGYWDIVILKRKGSVVVFCTGIMTHWVTIAREAGEELLTISLKPNIYIPDLSAQQLVDRALALPTMGRQKFYLGGSWVETPTFENAEAIVSKLLNLDILAGDNLVKSALLGQHSKESSRTTSRRFLKVAGVTKQQLQLISKARQAAILLQKGKPPSWVSAEVGYFDQPHMNRLIKQLTGQTPGEIYREGLHTTKDLTLV